MKKIKALLLLLGLVVVTILIITYHPVAMVATGILAGAIIIAVTSSGPLAYETPLASVWTRRFLLGACGPVGAMLMGVEVDQGRPPWLELGLALNPLWLLLTSRLDKDQKAMVGRPKIKTDTMRGTGDAWHPEWCASQLAYDVLQAHKAVEGYRMLGTELGHSGVPARVAAMHWLIKETEHTAGHHASVIKRLCCTYGAAGLDLKVWQDEAFAVGDYSGSPKSLQVHYEPGGYWATKRSGMVRREDLVIAGSQREQIDLLHWVSRGEG